MAGVIMEPEESRAVIAACGARISSIRAFMGQQAHWR